MFTKMYCSQYYYSRNRLMQQKIATSSLGGLIGKRYNLPMDATQAIRKVNAVILSPRICILEYLFCDLKGRKAREAQIS